jgi:putative NIF3 family GTP cyclohydrolase 1 type 2
MAHMTYYLPFSAFPNVQSSEPGPNGGKVITLEGITLIDAITRIKKHVGVDDCKVGKAVDGGQYMIKTIAICAGSGTSVLKGIKADLYLTGEMFHHDVLDANHQNTSVILLNHSNSERGFLKVFKEVFSKSLNDPSIEILISETDADPLRTL